VQSVADAEKDSLTKLSSDMDDVKTTLTNTAVNTQEEQKKFSALESLVGRFRFNGDVRIRGEGFYQDAPGFSDRNRARIRVYIQIGYAWLRQEQDSVIAGWSESDQRAPTNILQNKIYATWKLRSNVTAGYTYWFGRTLNTGLENSIRAAGTAAGGIEPDLKRMQFDLVYTF
jgi:hypothetical protein